MPTPPAAGARWNSMSSRVTRPRRLSPSYVAALMMRFRRLIGPSLTGANASGTALSAMLLLSPVGIARKAGAPMFSLQQLSDLRECEQLKYGYCRLLDQKRFDELGELLVE